MSVTFPTDLVINPMIDLYKLRLFPNWKEYSLSSTRISGMCCPLFLSSSRHIFFTLLYFNIYRNMIVSSMTRRFIPICSSNRGEAAETCNVDQQTKKTQIWCVYCMFNVNKLS